MKRKNFLLGAAALAAGCGGGSGSNAPLSYRRVELGIGKALGADDQGRIYLKRADGSSVRWHNGSSETLPIDGPEKEIRKVRADGVLLTSSGYFTPDNTYHPITLPTIAELGVPTEGHDSFSVQFTDAATPNDFIGEASFHLTGYGGPTGAMQTMVFVVRGGVPFLLPENYNRVVAFLPNGYFTATDRYPVLMDTGADRIFGPDNALIDHVANSLNIRLFQLSRDLNFLGRIIETQVLNTEEIATGTQAGYSLSKEPEKPRSHIRAIASNSRGDLIFRRVLTKEGETGSFQEWHMKLQDGYSLPLNEFIPELSTRISLLAFNARREMVLGDSTTWHGERMEDLFLLTPVS